MQIFRRTRGDDKARRRVVDLGAIDPLRFAQYQQWHDLLIAGPTRSVVGTSSNDFPGLYYYDPRDQNEHVLMFDGRIDWRSCRLERRVVSGVDGEHHLLLGLFSEIDLDESVSVLPWRRRRRLAGAARRSDRDAMPDQWEALEVLVRESFKLLPLPAAGEPYDWITAAEECLGTLNEKRRDRRVGKNELSIFFQTFVSDTSTYKVIPSEEYEGTAELICQAGLASSLLSYARTTRRGGEAFQQLGLRLEKTLKQFYDSDTGFFQNTYPPKGEEWERAVVDTWYSFHNLLHVLRSASLADDQELRALAHDAVCAAMSFVRGCSYQVPLFAKLNKTADRDAGGRPVVIGFALNPSVLGMYALSLIEAADVYPDDAEAFRDEAGNALAELHQRPWSEMFHQTVQLSWAAWAAHRLERRDWRDDFTRCLLLTTYRQGENAGLFQGCAGLGYPAFRETVDAVSPWIEWLDDAEDLPLRQILDLVQDRARRFLSGRPHTGLPQEGLATLEQPQAGQIGVAIYAAPQVFDLADVQRRLMRGSPMDHQAGGRTQSRGRKPAP